MASLAKLASPVASLRESADENTKAAGAHFESALGAALDVLQSEEAPKNWRLLLSQAAVWLRLGVASLGETGAVSIEKADAFCAVVHQNASDAPDFATALNAIARSDLLSAYVPTAVVKAAGGHGAVSDR